MKKDLTFYIICLLALAVTAGIGLTGGSWLLDTLDQYRRDVHTLRTGYMDRQRRMLKREVEAALDQVRYLRSTVRQRAEQRVRQRTDLAWQTARAILAQNRDRPRDEQARLVRETLRRMRYPDQGYYFAFSRSGIEELFTDRPEMEGKDMLQVRDSEGRYVVRDMLRLARPDRSSLYSYTWTRPGHGDTLYGKVAAIRILDELDWIIGTGIYLDEVEEEIKTLFLGWLDHHRWGPNKKNYLFAGTMEGVSLSFPFKGKNMIDITDPNGVAIVRELIARARAGGGFVAYVMPRTRGTRPAPKLSYAAPIREWEWYVGTGRYVDEIDTLIADHQTRLRQRLWRHLAQIGVILAALALICFFLVRSMATRIRRNITPFTHFFHRAANEEAKIDPSQLDFAEFRLLAEDANTMIRERFRMEQILRARERLLDELTRASLQLLAGPDLEAAVREALAIIGHGFTADRAYLFEVETDSDRGGRLGLRFEWCRGVASRLEDPRFRDLAFDSIRAPWFKRLQEGNAIQGGPDDFSPRAAAMMREYETRALLMVPILYRERFWGILCLDRCRNSDIWDQHAIRSLQSFATTLCLVIMQRRSERAAILHRDQWINTFNGIEDAIFLLDDRARLINANSAGLKTVQADRLGQILGARLPDLLHGEGVRFRECLADLVLERGIRLVDEIHSPTLDRTFQVSAFPLREKGDRVQGVIYIARDISDQKRMEQQLIQARKMEALGVMAGGIAHDFNNILAAIMGFAELARIRCEQAGIRKTVRDLDQILGAVGRARDLVAQMLAYSRKQPGKKTPLQVGPVAKETLKMLRAFIPSVISIRTDLRPETRRVLADPTALHQVLMNLASNAAHAMREQGGEMTLLIEELELEPERVAPHGRVPGPYLHIMVADQGSGIDPAIMDRIFDPFFTTKKTGEGTGMGLAAVQGIITSHDGFIEVDNHPGEGVAFHIYLPQMEDNGQEQEEESRAGPLPEPIDPGPVLVVDDESMLRAMYEQLLHTLGVDEVVTAEGPEQVLRLIREREDIALLLTDLNMPGMNGLQLARECHRLRPDLPILLCSGLTVNLDPDEIRDAGVSEVLTKPVTLQILARALARLTGRD